MFGLIELLSVAFEAEWLGEELDIGALITKNRVLGPNKL